MPAKGMTRDRQIVDATAKYALALERCEILKEAALVARDTAPEDRFAMLVAIIKDRLIGGRPIRKRSTTRSK